MIVDASVLVAALCLDLPEAAWSESVLGAEQLHAPQSIFAEVVNALRRLERGRRISATEANLAQQEVLLLPLELSPFAPFAERVWALRHNLPAHDAWYVAIAEAMTLPLATLDRRLSRASGPTCEFLLPD